MTLWLIRAPSATITSRVYRLELNEVWLSHERSIANALMCVVGFYLLVAVGVFFNGSQCVKYKSKPNGLTRRTVSRNLGRYFNFIYLMGRYFKEFFFSAYHFYLKYRTVGTQNVYLYLYGVFMSILLWSIPRVIGSYT